MHLSFQNHVQQPTPALIAGEIGVLIRTFEHIGIADQVRFEVSKATGTEEYDRDLGVQPHCILSFSLLDNEGENCFLECVQDYDLRGRLYANPELGMAFVFEYDSVGHERIRAKPGELMPFCKDIANAVMNNLLENVPPPSTVRNT